MAAVRVHLSPDVSLELAPTLAHQLLDQLQAAIGSSDQGDQLPVRTQQVLPDDHPLWERHSGGGGHDRDPEWGPADIELAEAFYATTKGKGRLLLDLLIDHPGQLLNVDELCALAPTELTSSRSIAGAINGMRLAHEASGRRYPFYWWEGVPSRYAVKASVAELFRRARQAVS